MTWFVDWVFGPGTSELIDEVAAKRKRVVACWDDESPSVVLSAGPSFQKRPARACEPLVWEGDQA